MASYLSIAASSQGKHTEKMSRFLAFAYPVSDIEQAKALIGELQREYCDARHVCWAWVIGTGSSPHIYSNDNGEPSGTAGKPILGQINSRGLRNVMVAVVRYFGGIKLGTPGLIAAYKLAAQLALDNAEIIEREEMTQLSFKFSYAGMNPVMTLAKQPGVEIVAREFDNECVMTLRVALSSAEELKGKLINAGALFAGNDDEVKG